jgi:GcrA cell cycle regulator
LLPRPEQIWPPERTAELLRLRERAMSARQIARELGVTRNAVIGKLHRLKLTIVQVRVTTDRHRQQRREQAARRRARERAARGPERDVRPRPARQGPTRAPVPGKVNIWGLTENACRWPLFGGNEPVSEQFYCGGEAVLGASYCGVHCKQSFGPSRPPMGRR